MKPANDRAVSVAQIAFGTATGTRAARRRSFTVWRADSRGAVVRRVSRSRTDVQYWPGRLHVRPPRRPSL